MLFLKDRAEAIAIISEEALKSLRKEQAAIIKKYNWKDFNKSELRNILRTKSWSKVIDKAKYEKREEEMYQNISNQIKNSKTSVVITGSGHIPFFKNKFPEALFPLS